MQNQIKQHQNKLREKEEELRSLITDSHIVQLRNQKSVWLSYKRRSKNAQLLQVYVNSSIKGCRTAWRLQELANGSVTKPAAGEELQSNPKEDQALRLQLSVVAVITPLAKKAVQKGPICYLKKGWQCIMVRILSMLIRHKESS